MPSTSPTCRPECSHPDEHSSLKGITVRLQIRQLDFRFRARESVYLPPFAGSACRGAFGHALRRAVCLAETPHCGDCPTLTECPYVYIFETPRSVCPAPPWLNDPVLPHPFVLRLPAGGERWLQPGEFIGVGARLIGRAATRGVIPFVAGMAEMGQTGLGVGLGRLDLLAVTDHSDGQDRVIWSEGVWSGEPLRSPWAWSNDLPIHPPTDRLRMEWVTPLRLARDGRTLTEADFGIVAGNLLRRIAILATCHCDSPPDFDWQAIWRLADPVRTVSSDLRYVAERRWSQRQRRYLKMDGLLGHLTVAGPLEPLLPFLAVGQLIHVGKATAFGCGEYRLHPPLEWPVSHDGPA